MTVPRNSPLWRKSSFSDPNACVGLAPSRGEFVVCDLKDPTGPVLEGRVNALIATVKAGSLTR